MIMKIRLRCKLECSTRYIIKFNTYKINFIPDNYYNFILDGDGGDDIYTLENTDNCCNMHKDIIFNNFYTVVEDRKLKIEKLLNEK